MLLKKKCIKPPGLSYTSILVQTKMPLTLSPNILQNSQIFRQDILHSYFSHKILLSLMPYRHVSYVFSITQNSLYFRLFGFLLFPQVVDRVLSLLFATSCHFSCLLPLNRAYLVQVNTCPWNTRSQKDLFSDTRALLKLLYPYSFQMFSLISSSIPDISLRHSLL